MTDRNDRHRKSADEGTSAPVISVLGYRLSMVVVGWGVVSLTGLLPDSLSLGFHTTLLWATILWLSALAIDLASTQIVRWQRTRKARGKKSASPAPRKKDPPVDRGTAAVRAARAAAKTRPVEEPSHRARWPLVRETPTAELLSRGDSKEISFGDLRDLPPLLKEQVRQDIYDPDYPLGELEPSIQDRDEPYLVLLDGERFDVRKAWSR